MDAIKIIDLNRVSKWELAAEMEERNRQEQKERLRERKKNERQAWTAIVVAHMTPFLFFLYWLAFGY